MHPHPDIEPPLQSFIRGIPDFPLEGILFHDIGTLLKEPAAFHRAINAMAAVTAKYEVDAIVALESRGFIFGSTLAYAMRLPLVLVRKEGKLPGSLLRQEYNKEYGADIFEMQDDVLAPGANVAIVDDILATGGSVKAVAKLLDQAKVQVSVVVCLAELSEFNERGLSIPVESLIVF
ncbi:MAG: adenine phosphoribosyltransferase [Chlamydiia bacterium]|nr:adenine phosphoribosyltransferase [Chlamydiia bacterium]